MNRSLKIALIIGGIVLAVILVLSIVPALLGGWQGYGGGYGWMGPGMMGGYGGMFFMPVLWVLFVGLIIWAVVAAVQRPGESGGPSHPSESALEILKQRYARGEIDKAEFEQRKQDLV